MSLVAHIIFSAWSATIYLQIFWRQTEEMER